MTLAELDNIISVVCPIYGINSNGDIWFKPESTPEQQALAIELMAANLENIT